MVDDLSSDIVSPITKGSKNRNMMFKLFKKTLREEWLSIVIGVTGFLSSLISLFVDTSTDKIHTLSRLNCTLEWTAVFLHKTLSQSMMKTRAISCRYALTYVFQRN